MRSSSRACAARTSSAPARPGSPSASAASSSDCCSPRPLPAAVGLGPDAGPEDIKRKALEGVAKWRDRAADPLADPAVVEVFETAARSCESIYSTT